MARVTVPQKDGEIRLAIDGNDAKVYAVANGVVNVDDADVARFLQAVEGSTAEGAKPAPAGEEK